MRWVQMLLSGGVVLWLLVFCLAVILYISYDRLMALRKAKSNIPTFSVKMRNILKKKEIQAAIDFCMEDKSAISNIMRRALKKYKFGRERFLEEVELGGKQEISRLEKGIPILATLATASPMLGFVGTIMGMVSTFKVIQDLHSSATVADFAGGVWEALITSAVGLIVGMIALGLHNYFVNSVKKLVLDIERIITELLDMIDSNDKEVPQSIETE